MHFTRALERADLEVLNEWWQAQGWPVIDPDFLPETGFIVSSLAHDSLAAGFVYRNNSKIWFFEWVVGNPDAPKEARREAVSSLIDYVLKWSKDQGARAVMTMTKHEGLISRLEGAGFQVADEQMKHLIKEL